MEAPPLKLGPVERLELVDEIISLGAHALLLRHPQPETLVGLSFKGLWDVDSAHLVALHLELTAWIADRDEAAPDAPEVADG